MQVGIEIRVNPNEQRLDPNFASIRGSEEAHYRPPGKSKSKTYEFSRILDACTNDAIVSENTEKIMKTLKIILGLLIVPILCSLVPQTAFCQMEKLGIVHYMPPKGWNKTSKENVVTFSNLNQTTGGFCIITVYGATPSVGNPQSDFTKEWKSLVVTPLKVEASPKTETDSADGWTAIAGGASAEFVGSKSIAFLTVISGFGKSVSVRAVFNDQSYLAQVGAFVSGIELDKTVAAEPQTAVRELVSQAPTRTITVTDLAGEWGENDGITTRYVDRYTGTYAGFESLHFTNKWTITKRGEIFLDFFGIQNGRKISEKSSGTVTLAGGVLVIKMSNTQRYVLRGWLETPEMTIMTLNGPWYDDPIPKNIFTDPEQGWNLDKNWVRKK